MKAADSIMSRNAPETIYEIKRSERPKNVIILHVVQYKLGLKTYRRVEKREYFRQLDGALFHGKRMALSLEDLQLIFADWEKIQNMLVVEKTILRKLYPNEEI